jgi:hypothetical protein
LKPEMLFALIGISIAAIICLSGKCKAWLEEIE